MTSPKMKKIFPLVKLPNRYYDPKLLKSRKWSPWHFPPRRKHIYIGIALDWVLIIILYLVTDWLFKNPRPPIAYFSVNDNSMKGPIVPEIISTTLSTLICTILPGVIMILLELIFFYDFWDLYHMIIGLITSIGLGLFLSALGWVTVGSHLGLRPTFLTKCQPDMSKVTAVNTTQTYFTSEICTKTLAKIEYQGFPSGHAATAFAGWVFFVLYINGKSKPWTGGAHLWKILLLILPLYFATWVSITRIMDYRHFPFQIIIGGLIGIGTALVSYRLHFGNNGWFLGTGDGTDHIPGHYKYLENWDATDDQDEVTNINDNNRDLEMGLNEIGNRNNTHERINNEGGEVGNRNIEEEMTNRKNQSEDRL